MAITTRARVRSIPHAVQLVLVAAPLVDQRDSYYILVLERMPTETMCTRACGTFGFRVSIQLRPTRFELSMEYCVESKYGFLTPF